MIGWIILLIGILITVGLIYLFRDDIQKWFKKNKKKATAVLTTGAILGAGGAGVMTDLLPGGYRPPTETLISNSEGHYWSATLANFKNAIYDLDNESGWVELPICNITVTAGNGIHIPSDIEIRGQGFGTILYLETNANESIFRNYSNAEIENVVIRDLVIDGNGQNQPTPTDWFIGDYFVHCVAGMLFKHMNDSLIENVVFRDTRDGAFVIWESGDNVTVNNCRFYNIGKAWEGEAEGLELYFPIGVHFQECNDVMVHGCYFNDVHGDCIVFEGGTGYDADYCVISQCIMDDAYNGVWIENAQNVVVSDCIATNMNKLEAYDDDEPSGYYGLNWKNLSFINCQAHYCGNIGNSKGYGFLFGAGNGGTVLGCLTQNGHGDGYGVGGDNIIISNSISKDDNDYGVICSAQGENLKVIDNTIEGCGDGGIFITAEANCIIRGNHIEDTGTYGIWLNSDDAIVSDNSIFNTDQHGIFCDGVSNSIVSNNWIHTVTDGGNDGIQLGTSWSSGTHNVSVIGNYIENPNDDGIVLANNARDCTVALNRILDGDEGVYEAAGCDYNEIIFNSIEGCSGTDIDTNGANTRVNCTDFDDWNFYSGVS